MSIKTSISWADLTINPITGCLNDCSFCYARRMAHRLKGRYGYPEDEPFRPTFHGDKLSEIYGLSGKGKRIFLDSMSDWCSPGVEPQWIKDVLFIVEAVPEHHFLVLTKRPDRIREQFPAELPENLWLGVSVTCMEDRWRIGALQEAWPDNHKFISFEPLHGPFRIGYHSWEGIEWAIVGSESGNRKGKITTEKRWVDMLCEDVGSIPVFMKENIRAVMGDGMRQEFPPEMA